MTMDLSVILYVLSAQNYAAGGLLTSCLHCLKSLFDDASMFAFNCAFDPVCTNRGAFRLKLAEKLSISGFRGPRFMVIQATAMLTMFDEAFVISPYKNTVLV
ncbi:hypothetical protein [Pseudomonas sp. W5-01]|uniref:hypothetical protein n=1 Tax=Pseudomonas sp. W5-01 TaxID=3097454 RepID=UPI00397B9FD0